MTAVTPTGTPTRSVSWAAATWTAPVVPALWLLVFLVVTGSTDAGQDETSGYAWGLGLAVAIAAVGAGLSRVRARGVRGVGAGLLAGGLACAIPSLWVLVT